MGKPRLRGGERWKLPCRSEWGRATVTSRGRSRSIARSSGYPTISWSIWQSRGLLTHSGRIDKRHIFSSPGTLAGGKVGWSGGGWEVRVEGREGWGEGCDNPAGVFGAPLLIP